MAFPENKKGDLVRRFKDADFEFIARASAAAFFG